MFMHENISMHERDISMHEKNHFHAWKFHVHARKSHFRAWKWNFHATIFSCMKEVLSKGVCTTSRWQASGRLVEELNVFAVISRRAPLPDTHLLSSSGANMSSGLTGVGPTGTGTKCVHCSLKYLPPSRLTHNCYHPVAPVGPAVCTDACAGADIVRMNATTYYHRTRVNCPWIAQRLGDAANTMNGLR